MDDSLSGGGCVHIFQQYMYRPLSELLTPCAEEGGASLFVEPISWMADSVVGAVQGKLYCPGCQARLGSFNWSGVCCLMRFVCS